MEHSSRLQQEQMHMEELGIATLTSCFINANIDTKKTEPAKPSDFFYHKPQEEKDRLDPVAADTFFSLVESEQMPSWAVAISPVDRLRAARANGSVPKVRAWIKKGVLLIAPRPQPDGRVKVPLAIVDKASGEIGVIDVDTGATYKVVVSNDKHETYWVSDIDFLMEG